MEWKRPATTIELASWNEIMRVAFESHEIGNHSWDHPSFPYASKQKRATLPWMKKQVVRSADKIRKRIPLKRFSWAWPYHWSVTHMTTIIKEHHTGIRPIEPRGKYNQTRSQKTYIKALNDYVDWIIKEDIWGLAVIHDIETGRDPLPEYVLRKHLEYVASKDIEVKTVSKMLHDTR